MFQFSMYFLSFAPLWACVILKDIFSIFIDKSESIGTEIISIPTIFIIFLISIVVMKRRLNIKDKRNSQKYDISECKEEKLLTAEFLFTFILPLFAFDFTKWQDVVLFTVFFCVFFWLCKTHNYFCVNIVLDVFRYRIYDCKLVNDDDVEIEAKVITKRLLVRCMDNRMQARGLNNDYLFDCTELKSVDE